MRELNDGSVALTVTSPPYWNAIDYDIHACKRSITARNMRRAM
jgi:site-specific DNA-methyltransferase (adenine-specific)